MPSNSCLVLLSGESTTEYKEVLRYIPSDDGYLTIIAQASTPLGFVHVISGDAEETPSNSNTVGGSNQWMYSSIPVVKGRTCFA